MAFVYWIRLEGHTDPYKEGYIGITTKEYVSQRFHDHIQSTRRGEDYCPVLSKAIRKYGQGSLILETLHEGSLDHCLSLENKYRPESHIGWNVAVGGQPTQKGVKRNKEQIENHSKLLQERMKYPWEHPDAKIDNWALAKHAYQLWNNGARGHKSIAKGLGKSTYSFTQMVKEFKDGWNPHLCQRWQERFE